jgi:hypothetical protein
MKTGIACRVNSKLGRQLDRLNRAHNKAKMVHEYSHEKDLAMVIHFVFVKGRICRKWRERIQVTHGDDNQEMSMTNTNRNANANQALACVAV